ncbi:MAG: NADH-quinone oxidoreductase subunit C [Actinomycetota bacterium]
MTSEELLALCARASSEVGGSLEPVDERGVTSLEVAADRLVEVVTWFRDNGPFELLADLSVIDWLGINPDEKRFCVGYMLASPQHPARLQLRVYLGSQQPKVASLTGLWPGADALEREAYDFFGIGFEGHPNLRRMFMPDDWEGHPQRKDYPLGGIDVRYEHGQAVTPPDDRAKRSTTTSGYPGRTA